MKYMVMLKDSKEVPVIAEDVDLAGEGDELWFNFTNDENITVGAFPFNRVEYIYTKS